MAEMFYDGMSGPEIRRQLNEFGATAAQAMQPAASSTSLTVGSGAKTLTVPEGRAFGVGQQVRIARTSAPATTWMQGTVTAYSGTSLTVQSSEFSGSGTYSDWTVTLAGGVGPAGDDGWFASWAIVSDGQRRVFQITDWFGGTGAKPDTGYLGASGIVANIAQAVDIRGPEGETGPANSLSIGTVEKGADADAQIVGDAPSQTLNLTLPQGDKGNDGDDGDDGSDGWTPVFAAVADGERRVIRIDDWSGGTGAKPATGYLGASGIVPNIGDAIDVRGAPGSGSVSSVNSVDPDGTGNVTIEIEDIDGLDAALADKVDKQAGYGLSQEDFTTGEKSKLGDIATGATNTADPVQSDWNADNGLAFIKNKPTIPAAPTAATSAQIKGLTTGNMVTPAALATAADEPGTIAGGTSITFNWAAAVNYTMALTGNRTLPNPTNVLPGTTRVIIVQSSTATSRTLAFGSNFVGDLPTVAVTNTANMVLFLYAISATKIVVSGVEI